MFVPRQPILSLVVEEKLKSELVPLWDKGLSAKEIAKWLHFGEGQYSKLKRYHVYYYRQKFKLPPRVARKSGISRYKNKPDNIDPLSFDEVIVALDGTYPLDETIEMYARRYRMSRAYILLHYYSPLRKSEIYERLLDDFSVGQSEEMGDFLLIDLYRKKKIVTVKKPAVKAPFYLSLEEPRTFEIIDWFQERMIETNDDLEEFVFPISSWQAWSIVKKAFPNAYPHYWRFKYITDRSSDPMIPIEDLLVETDLNILTLRRYMMTGERQRRLAFIRRRRRAQKQQI